MLATWGCTTFPKPTIDLQFAGATSLDNRITFTRATTATYFNSSGVLTSAASGVARFDYNPTTLAPLGLLIEEQRTNSCLQSEDFSTTWVTTNSSITTNVTTAPDGTTTADKLTEALDVNLVHQIAQQPTVTSLATYTASVHFKADTRTRCRVAFIVGGTGGVFADANLAAGTIGAASSFGGGVAVSSAIQSVGNGWFRVLVTGSGPAGTSGEVRCELLDASGNRQYNGDGTSGLFLWGAQLEAGAFPTSYIPTTTTALTRNADVASMTGTNFSDWYNASEGTVVIDCPANSSNVSITALTISDGTNSNRIFIGAGANNAAWNPFLVTSGTSQGSLSTGSSYPPQTNPRLAVAYKTDDSAACVSGVAPVVDTTVNLPVVNRMNIGASGVGTVGLNGTIRRIAYYPTRLANTTLQALTG